MGWFSNNEQIDDLTDRVRKLDKTVHKLSLQIENITMQTNTHTYSIRIGGRIVQTANSLQMLTLLNHDIAKYCRYHDCVLTTPSSQELLKCAEYSEESVMIPYFDGHRQNTLRLSNGMGITDMDYN